MRIRWPQSLTRTWDTVGASRRAAWVAVAMVVVIIAGMIVVATPLREGIARTREDIERNRLALDVARGRIAENAALAHAAAPVRNHDPRAAVDRVLSERGLHYAPVAAQVADGTVRIVIEAAPFNDLVRALDMLAREDGVRAADAIVSARVDSGTVRADLALTR